MKQKMLIKVAIATLLAIIVGIFVGPEAKILGVTSLEIFTLIGKLFLNALTLVVVPLVSASIITGTARMSQEHRFSGMGLKTFGFFFTTTLLAVLIGFLSGVLIKPGLVSPQVQDTLLQAITTSSSIQDRVNVSTFDSFSQILYTIIPSNILEVASKGQMLGLIFFCLLFGYFISKINPESGKVILGFFQGLFEIMMKMTHLIMRALPFGVFGLVAKVVATTGVDAFITISWFFFTAVLSLALFVFVILPAFLYFVAKISPLKFLRAMSPALFTGFSTSSSAATLPITIECVEKRAGVSNRISSFALPLGASINMTGTALHNCLAAIFISQAIGYQLDIGTYFTIILMAFLTSVGMAGIPSGCLVALVLILQSIGLPTESIALIFATERIVDMCRTVSNVFGNASCAVLVARTEGEDTLVT